MGSLIMPATGQVYAETNVVIYSVEGHPLYAPLCQPLWQAAQAGGITVVSSELTLMETLVGPLKQGDMILANDYEELWRQSNTRLLPITKAVLREAARLRASLPALRTPDAIHAATALLNGCALFLTNDTGFRRVPGLPLAVLDEVLAA
ncbi:MAG: PIN domain-containing protein [Armatimonadota bacterium]|nr:PIN domain-containing protein [Armatimonadota bacterium]